MVWKALSWRLRQVDKKARAAGKKRAGFAARSSSGLLAVLLGSLFIFGAWFQAGIMLEAMPKAPDAFFWAAGFQLLALWLGALLMSVSTRELLLPESDLEWLSTLPVPVRSLLVAKISERAVATLPAFLLVAPFLFRVSLQVGPGGAASCLRAFVALLPLLFLLGCCACILELGARMIFSPPKLRNLQALLAVGAAFVMVVVMPVGRVRPLMLDLFLKLPSSFLEFGPWRLTILALRNGSPGLWLRPLAAEWLLCALVGFLSLLFLERLFRDGVASLGFRETGRKKPRAQAQARGRHLGWLGPVARRELMLLARDRAHLVRTVFVPLILIGTQLLARGSTQGLFGSTATAATIAFFFGAYGFSMSLIPALNHEGPALWQLLTYPRPVLALLRDKAWFWGSFALLYPVVIFAMRGYQLGFSAELLSAGLKVAVGLSLFAAIAVAFGVFSCDPMVEDSRRGLKIGSVYLYLFLCSVYSASFHFSTLPQYLALILVLLGLAYALFQKAEDVLPYFFDPAGAPPPRVALADGLVAILLFMVLQALAFFLGGAHGNSLLRSFLIGGGLTYALMRFSFWWNGSKDLPLWFSGPRAAAAVRWGFGLGLAAGALGAGYLFALRRFWPELLEGGGAFPAFSKPSLLVLGIVAAPLFEEFIFRGLVYRGLRRHFSPLLAVPASAAFFALVHPTVSQPPVFILGVFAALAFERAGVLMAPVICHMAYNAVVLLAGPAGL